MCEFFQANGAICAILIFLAIVFLQSGLDKIFQFSGNLSWLEGHFANSILAKSVKPMLILLTLMEMASGLLSLAAAVHLCIFKQSILPLLAIQLATVTFFNVIFRAKISKRLRRRSNDC